VDEVLLPPSTLRALQIVEGQHRLGALHGVWEPSMGTLRSSTRSGISTIRTVSWLFAGVHRWHGTGAGAARRPTDSQ
jgi:hypothetical protein